MNSPMISGAGKRYPWPLHMATLFARRAAGLVRQCSSQLLTYRASSFSISRPNVLLPLLARIPLISNAPSSSCVLRSGRARARVELGDHSIKTMASEGGDVELAPEVEEKSSFASAAVSADSAAANFVPEVNGGEKAPAPAVHDEGEVAAEPVNGVEHVANGEAKKDEVKDENSEVGFARKEMYEKPLVGTVQLYERHVFLCYKDAESWPSQVEASEDDQLPRSLASALKARRADIPRKTRMTVCEGEGDGDLLIFPDMVRYKGLVPEQVETFVEEVLVQGRESSEVPSEKLSGSHVFVCAHGAKDRRCGYCGPVLIDGFKEEAEKAGLAGEVFVRPCSHIGGHKYAGNVIIFRPGSDGFAQGHWFGYVTPEDVPVLLEEHIKNGEVIERLWRGQMGADETEQKESQRSRNEARQGECACAKAAVAAENGGVVSPRQAEFCCKTVEVPVDTPLVSNAETVEHVKAVLAPPRFSPWQKLTNLVNTWERGDTLATLAVLGAASTVIAAYLVRNHFKARD